MAGSEETAAAGIALSPGTSTDPAAPASRRFFRPPWRSTHGRTMMLGRHTISKRNELGRVVDFCQVVRCATERRSLHASL